MNILILDNYDSFTYNLRQLLTEAGGVKISILQPHEYREGVAGGFSGIVFSPGPDIPRPGNVMESLLKEAGRKIPVLGICLGFQAIASFLGAGLVNLKKVQHGIITQVHYSEAGNNLFAGLANPFPAGLYHSWYVDKTRLPEKLCLTAWGPKGIPMAGKSVDHPWEGVQFHPESYMTSAGRRIVSNWIQHVKTIATT